METESRFIVTTKNEPQQTFVFDGKTTLDEVFAHVAERDRGGSGFSALAGRLSGDHKVFSLSISRDEFSEPTAKEKIEKKLDQYLAKPAHAKA